MFKFQIMVSSLKFVVGLSAIGLSLVTFSTAQAEDVYWISDESCKTLLQQTVPEIPGGFPLKFKMASGEAHYQLPLGGTLRLRLSEDEKVSVNGQDFSQAYQDLIKKRPLQKSEGHHRENVVVFAAVETGYQLDLDFTTNQDQSLFQLKPDGYNVIMNARFRVIDWSGYDGADAASRMKWDKMTCESYHHELGHVLIGAQIFSEAEPEWAALRGRDEDDARKRTDALFDYFMTRVRARQQKYHLEQDKMGRALADSRPYVDLPFSWLD